MPRASRRVVPLLTPLWALGVLARARLQVPCSWRPGWPQTLPRRTGSDHLRALTGLATAQLAVSLQLAGPEVAGAVATVGVPGPTRGGAAQRSDPRGRTSRSSSPCCPWRWTTSRSWLAPAAPPAPTSGPGSPHRKPSGPSRPCSSSRATSLRPHRVPAGHAAPGPRACGSSPPPPRAVPTARHAPWTGGTEPPSGVPLGQQQAAGCTRRRAPAPRSPGRWAHGPHCPTPRSRAHPGVPQASARTPAAPPLGHKREGCRGSAGSLLQGSC
mmetsp:Transcript_58643/g.188595  ORF Transcript_58643/g.188595 Transcript_58643/m.188595 type:complete len:270 (-) Transcript_58643:621-1430(-)